jgi:ribosome-binding factor A
MSSQRVERINEMIRQDVAASLFRVIDEPSFDHSAVTVMRAIISPDLRHAKVFVSVRGDAAKRQGILRALLHHRKELQASIGKHVVMKFTPHLLFELDESVERGGHVLDVIQEIEKQHPEWTEPPKNEP